MEHTKRPTIASIPDTIWSPMAAGVLMLLAGAIGLALGRPMLLPSIGPSAYLQAETPGNPNSKLYNTLVGHLVGIVAGFAAVFLLGAYSDPVVLQDKKLTLARVIATALALALTLGTAYFLRAQHPPAGATTLLITLGSIKTVEDVLNLILAVVIIAVAGEVLRRVRLGIMPAPLPDSIKPAAKI